MDFLISANPRVVFAFWLGVVVVAMATLMLLVILVMRQVVTRRERNRIRAATRWHQVLIDSVQGLATSPPSLPRSDLPGFVDAWNHVHQSLGTQDDAGLQRVAELRLAQIHIANRDFAAARAVLGAADDSAFAPLYYELSGDIAWSEGRFNDAREAYERALELDRSGVIDRSYVQVKLDDAIGSVPGSVADSVADAAAPESAE